MSAKVPTWHAAMLSGSAGRYYSGSKRPRSGIRQHGSPVIEVAGGWTIHRRIRVENPVCSGG